MLALTFTHDDLEALCTQRFSPPHPSVQPKMEAVLLRSQGVKQEHLLGVCRLCKATDYPYLAAYEEGGVEALKQGSAPFPLSRRLIWSTAPS